MTTSTQPQPETGGCYSRDPVTGALSRLPEVSADQAPEPDAPADPVPAKPKGGK